MSWWFQPLKPTTAGGAAVNRTTTESLTASDSTARVFAGHGPQSVLGQPELADQQTGPIFALREGEAAVDQTGEGQSPDPEGDAHQDQAHQDAGAQGRSRCRREEAGYAVQQCGHTPLSVARGAGARLRRAEPDPALPAPRHLGP